MPFNVNPPCASGTQTAITWQFPGQTQKSSAAGDDYRVYYGVSPSASRVSVNIVWNASLFRSDGLSSPCYNVNSYLEPNRRSVLINRVRELPLNPVDLFVQEPTYISNGTPVYVPGYFKGWKLDVKTYSTFTGSTPNITTVYQGVDDPDCYIVPGSLRNVAYIPLPSNGLKFVIDIYKNGAVIATDSGDATPVVTYKCGVTCPPNTCEVDCGTYVCCYGSDGISVFNYNK
jgi:hypothetical protein